MWETVDDLVSNLRLFRAGNDIDRGRCQWAADEIEKMRAALLPVTTLAERLTDKALSVGLAGTSEWDHVAGGVDIWGVQDDARSALGLNQHGPIEPNAVSRSDD